MSFEEIDAFAASQHGLVTSAQAVAALGASRKQRWTVAGRLIPVQPRVYRLLGSPRGWLQDLKAAELASGGLVSHRAAAAIWGLRPPDDRVEVAVHWSSQPRLRPPAIVHRLVDFDATSAEHRNGIRLTDPVRTLVDLGLVVPPPAVAAALDIGLGRRLFTLAEVRRLRQELSRCGRNGVGIIGELLDERWPVADEAESVLETRLLTILRRHRLPQPAVQFEVWDGDRFVARVDVAYPAARLVVEVDGYEHHSSVEAFQRDRVRQNELLALGWTVLRFTWEDVTRRPATVAHAIRAALLDRGASLCA
jgi:very-short-patch-repair endonuclease